MGSGSERRAWIWTIAVMLAVSACSVERGTLHTASGQADRSTTTSTSTSGGLRGVARQRTPPLVVGQAAWVSVSVATLWRAPDSPRPVDAPALANPADVPRWLDDMTLDQRRALNGRADTQALLGDRVTVLALPSDRPSWARVVVPSQPTPLLSAGYPGWVPRRQLTATPPVSSPRRATVVARTAWLLTDTTALARMFRVSLGTSLAVVGGTRRYVRVAIPGAEIGRLARRDVDVHDAGRPALAPSRRSVVSTAKQFLGLPYLWAGASGFGLDCSGLTWLVYRVHGIRIPRDAAPQSVHGTAVARPRPGDLMFYASGGVVHHVSIYAGDGKMIHSPGTGQSVTIVAVSASPYAQEYRGSRRYLP